MARTPTASSRRAACCALLAFAIAGRSWAESTVPAQAAQHFERGYELAQEGSLEAAISEFQKAYALKPHPQVLYNLGQAYAASGRAVEAVDTLTRYLSESTDASSERRRSVVTLIEAQKRRVGSLLLHIEPTGSAVLLDGTPVGKAPLTFPVRLTAGAHTIFVTHEGYEPELRRVEIPGQAQATLRVALGTGPSGSGSLRAGAGAGPSRELARLYEDKEQRRRVQMIAALVSGGLGAAGLATAAVLYATNQARYDDWEDDAKSLASRLGGSDPPSPLELDALLATENELRNRDAVALGLAVFGGVMVAGSAALWLTLPSKEPAKLSLRLGPVPWLSYSQAF